MAVNIEYDDSVLVNIFEGLKKQSYQKLNLADNYSKYLEQIEFSNDSIRNVVSFRFYFGEDNTYKKIHRHLSLDLNSLTDNQTLLLTVNYKLARNYDFIKDVFKGEYTSKVNIDFRDENWRIKLFKQMSNIALQEFSEYLTEKPELLKELSFLNNEFIHSAKIYQPESKKELKALCNDITVNLGNIDTSKITDMSFLFFDNCERTDFSGIESWDVSNVTNMSHMFHGLKLDNIDFSKWKTSNLKDMSCMFMESELSGIDLSNFDTSKVNQFYACFDSCHFDSDPKISSWNVEAGECFADMFLDSNFKYDLSKWEIKQNADTHQMTYNSDMKDEMLPISYLNSVNVDSLYVDDTLAEFEGQIIDEFENFLDEKGIKIENSDNQEEENAANIYGNDYGRLQESIENAMNTFDVEKASQNIVKEFSELLNDYGLNESVSAEDLRNLEKKTAETMKNWGFKISASSKSVKINNHR